MRSRPSVLPAAIVVAILLLVGLPVHEFAHALAAYRLGDGTAKLFGRLTLNPIAHFDPVGGCCSLTFIGSLVSGLDRLRLGEADAGQPAEPARAAAAARRSSPPPGRSRTCPGGRRGDPASAIIDRQPGPGRSAGIVLAIVLYLFVQINLLLMIFNFIPIPPLDGSKVLFAFLDPPDRVPGPARSSSSTGFLILLAVLFLPSSGELDRRAGSSCPIARWDSDRASWWGV